MKKQVTESLDKIKYLMEFHFKPHNRADSVAPSNDEQPVKFNDIGDVYKHQEEESDYPTFEQYRDDVMIDEEDPATGEEQPQQNSIPPAPAPESQPAPQGTEQPIPAGQEPPVTSTPEVPAAPVAPEPTPAPMPEPVIPTPAPVATSEPQPEMFGALEAQMAKTDEMLAKFDMIQQQLSGMETVNMKLNDVEKKLEDLKNPPYDEQLEMISKKAYPYNIKLSDFWGWDKDDEPVEDETFKLSPDDINNYNKDDIKKSFSI
jgi:hypothetical protein